MSYFDHEKWDVYRAALELVILIDDIVERLPRGRAHLADQLHRAGASIPLNIAEGAGEHSSSEKARFYRMARRSATECASILDICRQLKLMEDAKYSRGRELLLRIVAMLTRMVQIVGGQKTETGETEPEPVSETGGQQGTARLSNVYPRTHQKVAKSREELLRKIPISSGGTFNKRLDEMQAAGFIQRFTPWLHKKKEHYFRVIDEYSSFYLTWIDPVAERGFPQPNYWKLCTRTPRWFSWSGYAFESVCLKHVPQILHSLRLKSIACEIGSWRHTPQKGSKETGAQIDLLFDRQDNAITLCEIKYSANKYVIDKTCAKDLQRKLDVFQAKTKTPKQLFLALITTHGVKKNLWSEELVTHEVGLRDLFRK